MTTGTEILIDAMESLGAQGESAAMLVVWTDVDGDLSIRTSCTSSHAVGLARYAEALLLKGLLE